MRTSSNVHRTAGAEKVDRRVFRAAPKKKKYEWKQLEDVAFGDGDRAAVAHKSGQNFKCLV